MTPKRPAGIRDLLAESAEELYEEAPCGFLSAAPDGTVVRANRRAAALLGRPVGALVGQVRLQQLLTIGGRIYYETHVSPLLLMQGHVEEIALDLRRPEGPVPVLLNAVLRRDAAGDPLGIHATLLDVTERRRYERELLAARNTAEETARMKSELISMVSHDIRTPLSALSAVTELLERTPLSQDQVKWVRILKSSTGHLLRLINDVLDLGKLEAGRMRLEGKPVDLRQLVEDLTEELRVEADRKGLRVDVQVDSRLPPRLIADAIKVGRILSNLIGNAIKFTARGEVGVTVTLVRSDGVRTRVAFEVWDTGIGIPEDQRERIFDDFTQGSEEIGSRYGGSGLGLGICRKFLALYGAALALESTPGEGSRFRFELELEQPGPELVADPTVHGADPR